MNLDQLLAELRRRRPQLQAICQRYRSELHGIGPDDVEQEIAIRLLRIHRRGESDIDYLSSYIGRTAISVIIDTARKRRGDDFEVAMSDQPEHVADLQSELDRSDQSDLATALAMCLQQLPSNRRQVVELRLQEFTNQEIADQTGWTVAKVRNLATRGMATLRQSMQKAGYNYEPD